MGNARNVRPSPDEPTTPPLVAIGASAGGIEALRIVLPMLPPEIPAAVAIVLHRSASHDGDRLRTVLSANVRLPVSVADDGALIQPGRIALCPGGVHLVAERGRFRLTTEAHENGSRPAVDVLFRSVAATCGPRAVGVILSGTLDDGTAGLATIKAAGGFAVVQDPRDATFAGMPANAIENVAVDAIAPAGQLGAIIARFAHAAANRPPPSGEQRDESSEPSLFSCPDCGGVLSLIEGDGSVRFRCRTGHAYGPRTLFSKQGEGLEAALWVALRALVERTDLSERLAQRARERGLPIAAERFDRQAQEARRRAETVRGAIGGADSALESAALDEAGDDGTMSAV
jgi:two-component system, chemotaxis family, protein-glutamate methylesterase/glutaminase